MKGNMTTLCRTLACLLLIVFTQTCLAESGDESWTQVFNFQMKLAQQGNVKAQYILGEMYEQGRGVDKNLDTAISWYQKADKNGYKKAGERIVAIQESIRLSALEQTRAEADKKRQEQEAAKARQLEQQKKHAQEERLKQQALAKTHVETAPPRQEVQAPKVKVAPEEAALSPEERAQKVKEAQERAQEIAKQNALHRQQEAEAELEKYKASIAKPTAPPAATTTKSTTKYQDPFE